MEMLFVVKKIYDIVSVQIVYISCAKLPHTMDVMVILIIYTKLSTIHMK